MMKILQESLADTVAYVTKRSAVAAGTPEVEQAVTAIIQNVRDNGDQAIREYEKKFDDVELNELKVPQSALEEAYQNAPQDLLDALELAKRNITSYHEKEKQRGFVDTEQPGVMRGERITPLAAVGVYVPGGTAAYPSSILMNVLPAKIAGVTEIYQVGGAQAIAALAYGTESIPRVDKITGPGNIFVATAKKQVFGQVSIDMIAGPSEIGVIADDSADVENVAADLLSQAEHDKLARPMLVTPDLKFAKQVSDAVDRQLETLPRKEIATASVNDQGFIAIVDSLVDAFTVMNAIAPEHLEVQLDNAAQYLSYIKNAGSVFLGFAASEPVGDYVAGPNHIFFQQEGHQDSSQLSV